MDYVVQNDEEQVSIPVCEPFLVPLSSYVPRALQPSILSLVLSILSSEFIGSHGLNEVYLWL